jgi:hypothetical protein
MSGRNPVLRMLVMVGAALQLLSPGVASIAHGMSARENASGPLTHIESTTTATCPVVHAPDCGVCRYLSTASTLPRATDSIPQAETAATPLCASGWAPSGVRIFLPDGRAPPVL